MTQRAVSTRKGPLIISLIFQQKARENNVLKRAIFAVPFFLKPKCIVLLSFYKNLRWQNVKFRANHLPTHCQENTIIFITKKPRAGLLHTGHSWGRPCHKLPLKNIHVPSDLA